MLPRLRLGHIVYSNCFPVHARFIDRPLAGDPALVAGIPSELNRMLRDGDLDVAPSSSIEYAHNWDRYFLVPELVIGSRGPVRSILLMSDRHPSELEGSIVGIPTASATSVVLLKILLRVRWGVTVQFRWFDQVSQNPFADGADAALFIGDVALRADLHPEKELRLDLGEEWADETGLPFAFALWQVAGGSREQHRDLMQRLRESRAYGLSERVRLAERYADHFDMPAEYLGQYWHDLEFRLDERMAEGLEAFYGLAADIGAIRHRPALRWLD